MSFSFEAKNELCRLPVQKLCCARAEAYGILLLSLIHIWAAGWRRRAAPWTSGGRRPLRRTWRIWRRRCSPPPERRPGTVSYTHLPCPDLQAGPGRVLHHHPGAGGPLPRPDPQ